MTAGYATCRTNPSALSRRNGDAAVMNGSLFIDKAALLRGESARRNAAIPVKLRIGSLDPRTTSGILRDDISPAVIRREVMDS